MNYWQLKDLGFKYLFFVLVCTNTSLCFAQQDSLQPAKKIKLDEAIVLGIQNNKQLKIANTNLAIANENTNQAKIAKMPRVGLSAGYTYIVDPKLYEGFYESNITVDYFNRMGFANIVSAVPIYSGGAIKNRIEQQKRLSQMQESVVKMTEADVKNAITEQYFTLEKLYRQIEVTKQNIINTDLRISQLKSRVNNGQNLKSDLLRTELQQSNFKVSVLEVPIQLN